MKFIGLFLVCIISGSTFAAPTVKPSIQTRVTTEESVAGSTSDEAGSASQSGEQTWPEGTKMCRVEVSFEASDESANEFEDKETKTNSRKAPEPVSIKKDTHDESVDSKTEKTSLSDERVETNTDENPTSDAVPATHDDESMASEVREASHSDENEKNELGSGPIAPESVEDSDSAASSTKNQAYSPGAYPTGGSTIRRRSERVSSAKAPSTTGKTTNDSKTRTNKGSGSKKTIKHGTKYKIMACDEVPEGQKALVQEVHEEVNA